METTKDITGKLENSKASLDEKLSLASTVSENTVYQVVTNYLSDTTKAFLVSELKVHQSAAFLSSLLIHVQNDRNFQQGASVETVNELTSVIEQWQEALLKQGMESETKALLTQQFISQINEGWDIDFDKAFDLIKQGADVNIKNKAGWSFGHIVAGRCDPEILQVALDAGMDVNAKTNSGWSIGHAIAQWGTAEMFQMALDAGMDINAQDYKGMTILDVCDGNDKEAKIHLIKDHIEKLESQSETGLDR